MLQNAFLTPKNKSKKVGVLFAPQKTTIIHHTIHHKLTTKNHIVHAVFNQKPL